MGVEQLNHSLNWKVGFSLKSKFLTIHLLRQREEQRSLVCQIPLVNQIPLVEELFLCPKLPEKVKKTKGLSMLQSFGIFGLHLLNIYFEISIIFSVNLYSFDVDAVVSFESLRALKLSNYESFRALKLSLFASFRVIKF